MRLKEIMQMLEELCPPSFAMSWDNVGLLVGSPGQPVRRVMLALDPCPDLVRQAAAQSGSHSDPSSASFQRDQEDQRLRLRRKEGPFPDPQ